MPEEPQKKSLQNLILEKIKTGQTKMRPKWHFVLKTSLWAAGVIIGALALLYVVSFILFILRQTGVWFLPTFGLRGIMVFLTSAPWLLILLGIVFIILLEILVRHYSFGWKKPLLYSLLGIIGFVVLASFLVSKTSFHENLFMRARQGGLPYAGQFYRDFGMPRGEHAQIGVITEITDEGFKMETQRGEALTIIVGSQTSFPLGLDFQKGDRVVVMGEREDHTIKALGIRRIDDMMPGNMMRQRIPRQGGWFMPTPNRDF